MPRFTQLAEEDAEYGFEGDEYFRSATLNPCWHCGNFTRWISISFEAHLCSTECAHAKWQEYFKADNRAMTWERIDRAKERLERNEPDIAITMLRDIPEIEPAGLSDLVWSLDSGRWGIHANDVRGVIELLERYLENNK